MKSQQNICLNSVGSERSDQTGNTSSKVFVQNMHEANSTIKQPSCRTVHLSQDKHHNQIKRCCISACNLSSSDSIVIKSNNTLFQIPVFWLLIIIKEHIHFHNLCRFSFFKLPHCLLSVCRWLQDTAVGRSSAGGVSAGERDPSEEFYSSDRTFTA